MITVDNIFLTVFTYSFMTRAIISGVLVSLCASVLGVPLVLKRYSMIGDGLSHVSFGALSVAAALSAAPLAVSLPIVIISAFFLLRITENSSVGADAAVAVFSSSALAVGIIVTSLTTGINADICNYMFGSILAMSKGDVYISAAASGVILVLYLFFYNRIFAVTFDETFCRATGVRTGLYNSAAAVLTAVTVVLGMRIMGALLISSLIIFPSLSAMRICKYFKGVILLAAFIGAACFFAGIIISYIMQIPVGASVVAINLLVFIISCIVSWVRKRGC